MFGEFGKATVFFPRYLEDFGCLGMSRVSIRGGASENGFQPDVFFSNSGVLFERIVGRKSGLN